MRVLFALLLLLVPAAATADEGYVQALQDGYPVCLIAGLSNGEIAKLEDPETTVPPELGARDWSVITLDGVAGAASGSAPAMGECGCLELPQVSLNPQPVMTGLAIATNLSPGRIAKVYQLSTTSPAYLEAARVWLAEQDMTAAPVQLNAVIRTDLEGDGVDEVLLAGHYNAMADFNADRGVGRYAFLLLRRLVDGKVVTRDLESYVDPAPYTDEQVIEGLAELEPVAILDLTGDGVAEVVIAVWTHEALIYSMYQLEEQVPNGVVLDFQAECGCGC